MEVMGLSLVSVVNRNTFVGRLGPAGLSCVRAIVGKESYRQGRFLQYLSGEGSLSDVATSVLRFPRLGGCIPRRVRGSRVRLDRRRTRLQSFGRETVRHLAANTRMGLGAESDTQDLAKTPARDRTIARRG